MMLKKRTKIEGFSLMEISIVLLIIGIVAGGMLKGRDLVEAAQIKSVINDIENFRIAYATYLNSYGSLPGDDSEASEKFASVSNGDGDGKISSSDAKNVLKHLYAAGLIDSLKKHPKIGGNYDVISQNDTAMLNISKESSPFLTKKQVINISAKIKEAIGDIEILVEPKISENSSQKYTIKIRLD